MAKRHATRGGAGRFVPARAINNNGYIDSLTPGIAAYGVYVSSAVNAVMREWGKDAVEYMKENAPWQDRTGDARESLDYSIDENAIRPSITLYHGVSYGIYLEVRWSGEYAIIVPTLEAFGPELMRRIEAVI